MDLNAVQTLKVQSAQRRQQSSAMAQASQYAHAAAQYAMPYMTAQQQQMYGAQAAYNPAYYAAALSQVPAQSGHTYMWRDGGNSAFS